MCRRDSLSRKAALTSNGSDSQRIVAVGIAIGIAVGTLVGLALRNVGRGITLGIIIGAAIGTAWAMLARPLGTSQKRSD